MNVHGHIETPGGAPVHDWPKVPDLEKWALFLDIDGTLLDIAATPEGVVVPSSLAPLLEQIRSGCGGAMALVTGREIMMVDRFFAPFQFTVAGIHGAEIRLPDGTRKGMPPSPSLPHIVTELGAYVKQHEGLLLEEKGRAVAVHFRLNPTKGDEVEALVRRLVEQDGLGLEVQPGKMVVEVRPARADKGNAIEILLDDPAFSGKLPLFIGDDWTDESAFRVVNVRGGRSIRVGRDVRPTDALENLPDPTAVRAWLSQVAEAAVNV
jgi:trehalose 6-phosphate phosphatase